MQTIISQDGCKIENDLDRLLRLRKDYYIQLMQEMDLLRRKRIDLVKSYKIEMWGLDKQIIREQHRVKKQ